MRILSAYTFLAGLMMVLSSCKKDYNLDVAHCADDKVVVRTITDQEARVSFNDDTWFITEKNTIDTKLRPCNLPEEFKKTGLDVIISGDVKQTDQQAVCCIDDFDISEITKK